MGLWQTQKMWPSDLNRKRNSVEFCKNQNLLFPEKTKTASHLHGNINIGNTRGYSVVESKNTDL